MSDITEPQSPCVDVCELDNSSDVCSGCYRTLDEIAMWSACSAQDKRLILKNSEQRKLASGASSDTT